MSSMSLTSKGYISHGTSSIVNRMTDEAGKKSVRRHVNGATAHEQLIDAAQELFYREGVRAVGVDAVVERAGVNKMSLYRQFASKDELVAAYLTRMDERFR